MDNQIQSQEQSTSVVIKRQGKTHSLIDLGERLKKELNQVDLDILTARSIGRSFCDLTKDDFDLSITGILFKISVICGCQLPTHDAHIEALEKEFGIFLTDYGYSGLTTEEALTAFRMNANYQLREKIETFGAVFNIDFASKVLRLYRERRGVIDQIAERIIYNDDVVLKLSEEENKRRLKIIQQFDKYLMDENAELDLSNCFMQLRQDEAFSNKNIPDDGTNYFRGSTELERLYNSFESLDTRFKKEHYAVRFLFENMKKTGKVKIYDENMRLMHPGFELPELQESKDNLKEY